jgi:tRNA-Thr(GGU) m(6)t(6)A37 methyltransferase TsaA
MNEYRLHQIGTITRDGERSLITLDAPFRAGLLELPGFSHVNVVYWFHGLDNPEYRSYVSFPRTYTNGPDPIGVFATRSPVRPNPIGLTTCPIVSINQGTGVLTVTGLDAEEGSPLLDLKPYHPSEDRVRDANVPKWCSHWPSCVEDSVNYDWEKEMVYPT